MNSTNHRNWTSLLLPVTATLLLAASAGAATDEPQAVAPAPMEHRHPRKKESDESMRYEWLDFSLSGLAVLNSGGQSYSGVVAWTPHLVIHDKFEVGLNLGGSTLGNALGQGFPVAEYQLTGGMDIYKGIGAELGAGGQTWGGPDGATAALFSADAFYKLHVSVLDRVFVGYSAYLLSFFYTSEIKLGVALRF